MQWVIIKPIVMMKLYQTYILLSKTAIWFLSLYIRNTYIL